MKISAVIVTYNRLHLLKQSINCLLQQNYELNDIFIVNNHSNDGTREYLNNINDKKIHPINMSKNLGGAGGFSFGTKIACEYSHDSYFWLMDDDTMPTKLALSKLVHAVNQLHGRFGYLCSNVRWWKNFEPSYLNVPVASRDWNFNLDKGLIKTISASFVSLLVPRNLIEKFGLPIADMFIWGDDVEYTTRLSKVYPSYLVSNSIVLHKSKTNSTNESVFNVSMKRLIYYKCMFRNRLYIGRKYYGPLRVMKLLILYMLFLLRIPFIAKDHKLRRMRYTFTGIFNGLFFNPKIKFPDK